jgi:hypothetical protein
VAHWTGQAIQVIDASASTPSLINTIYVEGIGDNISLNNNGVIGAVTTVQTVGGNWKRQDFAIQLDAATGVTDSLLIIV